MISKIINDKISFGKISTMGLNDDSFTNNGGSRSFQSGLRQPQRGGGSSTYYLTNFSRKLHENKEISAERRGRASLAPPMDPPLTSSHIVTLCDRVAVTIFSGYVVSRNLPCYT